ncbi:MAG: hypothetical protein PWP23_983 [Candidatus Sumerlaeota bacterium]|nr:hypothetical protein [Candidatus Sumerlaeota bacterium]
MGHEPQTILQTWWGALVEPHRAGRIVLGSEAPPGFTRRLTLAVAVLYCIYGVSMGSYRGIYPALISGLKLPFLYLFSLLVCFPPLYVLNGLLGPRLSPRQCMRLLVLAMSANAAALASYALFSLFFGLTTSHAQDGYSFLVLMHVGVFATSGCLSLTVIGMIFRATARELGRRLHPAFLAGWGILYGVVGAQTAWLLRPWIGTWDIPYQPLRPIEGSFFESVWMLLADKLG